MIIPTVGRKVWYIPSTLDVAGNFGMIRHPDQPLDATVIGVKSDRCVNLQVIDLKGRAFFVESAMLVQDSDPEPSTDYHGYATWMPYQVGQAVKASAAPSPALDAVAIPTHPVKLHIVREEIEALTDRVVQHMSDGTLQYRSAIGVHCSDLIGN